MRSSGRSNDTSVAGTPRGHGVAGSGSTSSAGSTSTTTTSSGLAPAVTGGAGAGAGARTIGAATRGAGPCLTATKSYLHTSQKRASGSARGSLQDGQRADDPAAGGGADARADDIATPQMLQ